MLNKPTFSQNDWRNNDEVQSAQFVIMVENYMNFLLLSEHNFSLSEESEKNEN